MDSRTFENAWLDDPRDTQRDACGVGFVAHLKGVASHTIVAEGLRMLSRLDHRGGRAADNLTSDGAGLLTQIPHDFLADMMKADGVALPDRGDYALGMFFLPCEEDEVRFWLDAIRAAAGDRCPVLYTRMVPVDSSVLGPIAREAEPRVYQLVFGRRPKQSDGSFIWQLYTLRKTLERQAWDRYGLPQHRFYCASLSRETVCYKGLILSRDLARYYPDLADLRFTSALAMVHQRFSTNTLPAWSLAQPFRLLCHNGEINTLRGNLNAMHARTRLFSRKDIDSDLPGIQPICAPGGSDSAMLDNAIELLVHAGRPLTQVLSMLIPEPWSQHAEMSRELKDYYEYQSYLMEPWDGPAFIGFCQGQQIGAILDRNGLRPGRYCVTRDDIVIMASEAGVLDVPPESVIRRGRLSPGRMFLVDMKEGRIVADQEIKAQLAASQDYGAWLAEHRRHLADLPLPSFARHPEMQKDVLARALKVFGYTREDLRVVLAPMANEGKEAVGSMGNDTPLAILSHERPLLFNYFKQLFAQVTNPPIDAIREELVTSLGIHLGAESNLLAETPEHCRVVRLSQPILSDSDLQRIEYLAEDGLVARKLSMTFRPEAETLAMGLQRLCEEAARAIAEGISILILSDRAIGPEASPMPSLLATAAVHHDLIRRGTRMQCSLVVETGEAREVHHFALLIGYGAAAINPYIVFALLEEKSPEHGFDAALASSKMQQNFIKAVGDGLLKVMSKMGISTLQSYRGAQIFEAIGLSRSLVDRYFTWTPTRIEGLELDDIEDDLLFRHRSAHAESHGRQALAHGGFYHWRRSGEQHLHHPDMIALLQKSARIDSREEFKTFCASVDAQSQGGHNLRGLLRFKHVQDPVPLDEVESVVSIVKRFATGAMSFGSISKEAHETIAIAMNRIGARSNSGEGGEDASRFIPAANGDLRRSAIKQVASARFGVTSHYLVHADELQIKMAQGAKPGEGGQLPGHKVDEEIARVRHSTPGITLISPPPHHDIYSIEDLAQLIFDLKNANRSARVSVKLVSEVGVGTIAAGVAKAKADAILISGYEGGTGASPLSSIKHAGLPWELGLAETHRALVGNQLRTRVSLQADGQLRTPRDIAIATLLGAEEWGVGTGALIALGCIMMRKCHLNTCPVGIATQDPELRRKFRGEPEHVVNYFFLLAEGLRELMAQLGFRRVADMVGRVDLLEKNPDLASPRLRKIDVSALLAPAPRAAGGALSCSEEQDHGLDATLDHSLLLAGAENALAREAGVRISLPITTRNRAVGTMLSAEISRRWGAQGLSEGAIQLEFRGAAGQSFMAFAAKGLSATLIGEANDYCGKGLSGAHVVIRPFEHAGLSRDSEVICGNVALYGATSGFFYARGQAGERFAVRNSGAHAVVEGLGDHGCEYMTGGSVVVIGPIGRNFAAGMSGGYAYLYKGGSYRARINSELITLHHLDDSEDASFVARQLEEHARLTGSREAQRILANWEEEQRHFLAVVPRAYRDLMRKQRQRRSHARGRLVGGGEVFEPLLQDGGSFHG